MTYLEKMHAQNWNGSSKELTDPVVFRQNERPFIIRTLKKIKDRIMAKLEMDDDNIMYPFEELPWNIQQIIYERI